MNPMPIELRRRFFAEEIAALTDLKNARLVDALATVPRDAFLPAGPWRVKAEGDLFAAPRLTPDDDPRHVYHNCVVAIDPARQLFNGQPSLIAMAIDRLALEPGARVAHIGAGLGYFTALIAHTVGADGAVLAVEVDAALASAARANLRAMPWVDVRRGDAAGTTLSAGGPYDAILVNAGVTHPLDDWLAALGPGGRMILPLTAALAPGSPIGKGLLTLITAGRDADDATVRVLSFVAIYSALGLRDDARNAELGRALRANPVPPLKRLRRDAHDPADSCWFHAEGCCFSLS
jgi:protein-L-isoaspartate(D-aspartate) O-methyltransferase